VSHQLWPIQHHLLCDHAAARKAEQVDALQAKRVDKSQGVSRHGLDTVRSLSTRTCNTPVVEQDHFAVLSERVGNNRVPIVHRAREMLAEQQRKSFTAAKLAISEPDAVSLDITRRCGFVCFL